MAKARDTITQAQLKDFLHYDPDTGVFTWRKTRGTKRKGSVAGSFDKDGYRRIGINKVPIPAHRLAWLYVYGRWPDNLIDHINGIVDDNRIANLREADFSQNCQNLREATQRSKTGLLGVRTQQKKHGVSYQAAITVRGKFIYLGTHPTPEAAHAVYMEAKERLHQF